MSSSPFSLDDDTAGADPFAPVTDEERRAVATNPFEELKAALEAPVEREPKLVRVPSRPGITLSFDPSRIDDERRKAWQKRATKKHRGPGRDDEVDEMLFACLVIANANDGVMINGVRAHDAEDTPLTFAHRQLWDMVGAREPASCIRRLFANDAHVLIASGEVLMAAGFDDDLTVDPTEAGTL